MNEQITLGGMRGVRVQLAHKINITIEQFLDQIAAQPTLANVPVDILVAEVMGAISLATLERESIAIYLASKFEHKQEQS